MKFTFILSLLLAAAGSLYAKDAALTVEPALNQNITVNGKSIRLDGEIKEIDNKQLMAFGEKVYSFPAKNLVGKTGSIVLEFALPSQMLQSKSAGAESHFKRQSLFRQSGTGV